jgi:hypothetical protein
MSTAYISNDFITEFCSDFIGLVLKLTPWSREPSWEDDSSTEGHEIPTQRCLFQLK